MSGAEMITVERQRQISQEGWTTEHDDEHVLDELGSAAAAYLAVVRAQVLLRVTPDEIAAVGAPGLWPWASSWWKPSDDPIRNLVKAGALIAAEIDRLQRASSGPDDQLDALTGRWP